MQTPGAWSTSERIISKPLRGFMKSVAQKSSCQPWAIANRLFLPVPRHLQTPPLDEEASGYGLRPCHCFFSDGLASINARIASRTLCTSSRKASTVGDDGAPPAANSIATRWAPKLAANGKIEDGQVLGPSDVHCRRQLRHRYPTRQGAGPWIYGQAR